MLSVAKLSMLSITFLGTAGSVPTKERSMPAIALRWQGKIFLWDCGEGTQRQMMHHKVGYGSLKAIFISHLHLDHFIGVYGLIETLHLTQVSPGRISLFAPKGFENLLINKRPFVEVQQIRTDTLLEGDDFTINAFPVEHSTKAYGFLFQQKPKRKFNAKKAHKLGLKGRMFREIQEKGYVRIKGKKITLKEVSWLEPGIKVVYSGDSAPCKEIEKAAKGADLLIHEATFAEDRKQEAKDRLHTTAKQAAQLAKKAKVKQLALTHISSRYADMKVLLAEAKAVFNNTIVAKDGIKISL